MSFNDSIFLYEYILVIYYNNICYLYLNLLNHVRIFLKIKLYSTDT